MVNSTGFNIPTHGIKRALSHDFRYPICTSTEMGDSEEAEESRTEENEIEESNRFEDCNYQFQL